LISLALILAGALGNVIDSTFYGVILDNAPGNAITPWFHGQVVDMLYFPLYNGSFPEWLPIWGDQPFQFFRPVFNIADASIFVGVTFILILQNRFYIAEQPTQSKVAIKTKSI
jgi:signal peptidase II